MILKEIDHEISMNLCVLSHPEYEKMVFGMLSTYIYGLMCVLLVPKWLGMCFSYSVFKSLPSVSWCLVNMNILTSKIGPLQIDPQKTKWLFSKNICDDFD